MHVLFVCTGNICRSPIAERLATVYGNRLKIPQLKVSSAGTRAVISHPIHCDAAHVLRRLGGDPSNFAARQLTTKVATEADLILAMTRRHRDAALELAPHKLHRSFTLGEVATLASLYKARTVADLPVLRSQLNIHEVSEVIDPIGQEASIFSAVGAQIAELLIPTVELIRRSSIGEDLLVHKPGDRAI